jgi:undecaprenyl-diphosphatase
MDLPKKIYLGLLAYAVFLGLVVLFLKNILNIDVYLFFLINGFYNPYLELFFNVITNFGSIIFWVLIIVLFLLKGKRRMSLHLVYALVMDVAVVLFLKGVFLRPRPFETFNLGIDLEMGTSFPSGHGEIAFSGAFVLSNYYKKYSHLFYILAVLVAFSRVYLGLHFPLDVIIGSINGLIIGRTALAIPTKRIEKSLKH